MAKRGTARQPKEGMTPAIQTLCIHLNFWRHYEACLRTGGSHRQTAIARSGLCGRVPLVLAPHTIMCMGEESFPEENRSPLHVWTEISL